MDSEFQVACQLHAAGRLSEAEQRYRQILHGNSQHAGALANLGMVLKAQGRAGDAIELYRRAIALEPQQPHLHRNLGNALTALGQHGAAVEAFRAAVLAAPTDIESHLALARGLRNAGRPNDAIVELERTLTASPDSTAVLELLGEILIAQHDPVRAAACFAQVVKRDGGSARARHNLGCALWQIGHLAEARRQFESAIRMAPAQFQSYQNLADAISHLESPDAAIPFYRKAVELAPKSASGWYALGWALSVAGAPEAERCFQQVLALAPEHLGARTWSLTHAAKACDFPGTRRHLEQLKGQLSALLSIGEDWRALANLVYASIFCPVGTAMVGRVTQRIDGLLGQQSGSMPASIRERRKARTPKDRIRIGYLSPNFRDHPVGHVTRSLFRHHRRDKFEIHGFSTAFRPDHPSYTPAIAAGCDRFHVLGRKSAQEAAEIIRGAGIDILVDLDGYMDCTSPPILALRPAPVQTFWLGHAGGLGLSCVDYLIADRVVVPAGEEANYREQIVRLPHGYHCADRPEIATDTPNRAECGLPESGLVFCAFNNPQKITAATFDCWMRILRRVDGACLWLSNPQRRADLVDNLRARAAQNNVAPERLVFASRMADKAQHLARHRWAGLFLDTADSLSASTTGLDALWAGVPLLTVRGDRFASRIATTFLHCLGLDDLVCVTLAEYEERAVALATRPAELATVAAQLQKAKCEKPLFQTDRFVRDLERAYERMWSNHTSGRAPAAFDLPPAD